MMLLYLPAVYVKRGRNGFDGDTGLKMRVEDHFLVKKMELNIIADQELALAA